MMKYYPNQTIDDILGKIDIVEIISSRSPLKKIGRNFKALCPFHNEKTPSFLVSQEKQIFHCFGCGAGGNAISFLMRFEKYTFGEALKVLAEKAGVKLPASSFRDRAPDSLTSKIFNVNENAKDFYRNYLLKSKNDFCYKYLKERGLSDDAISVFQLGFAPDMWEGLFSYFKNKNISPELLEKAGLIIPSTRERGFYDRFRNRIIFTIFDIRGKVIGFGGRSLGDIQPKYINSPETPVYTKGEHLYGLNFSRQFIREKDYAIIVEGYLDLIIPYQHGIKNIVATLGTALTPHQIRLLKRFTRTIVVVFDADKAGEEASLRGLDLLVSQDVNVRIATLPKGFDPDSFVRSYGKEAFEKNIKASRDIFDYKMNLLMNRFNKDGVRGKAAIATLMLPTIQRIPNEILKAAFLKKLSEVLSINESALRTELKKVKTDFSYSTHMSQENMRKAPSRQAELLLLGIILDDPEALSVVYEELGLDEFRDTIIKKALSFVQDCYKKNKKIDPSKVINYLDDENVKDKIIEAVSIQDTITNKKKVLSDCMFKIKEDNFKEDLKKLQSEIRIAQDSKDNKRVDALLFKYNDLLKTHRDAK